MVSQKSLSHSTRMLNAAPSLRLFLLPSNSRFLFVFLEMSASSLADVSAARGGLEGGDSQGFPRTSGKPLCPAGAGSGVMKSSQTRRGIDYVAAGEDVGLTDLAIAITTITMTVGFTGRHCFQFLPRLRLW